MCTCGFLIDNQNLFLNKITSKASEYMLRKLVFWRFGIMSILAFVAFGIHGTTFLIGHLYNSEWFSLDSS